MATSSSRSTRSRAVYFWVAIGVFVAVLAIAQWVDPAEQDPVRAAEPQESEG